MTDNSSIQVRKEVKLIFAPDISGEPVVCNLVRDYNTLFNILHAQISSRKEGNLTLELIGTSENIESSIEYLKSCGVKVRGLNHKVHYEESLCMHCGMCTAVCKTEALFVDNASRLTKFDPEKCISCGLCSKICPVNAMQMDEQHTNL